jgi:hypothetical protein
MGFFQIKKKKFLKLGLEILLKNKNTNISIYHNIFPILTIIIKLFSINVKKNLKVSCSQCQKF